MDAARWGNTTRFINYSCEPNLDTLKVACLLVAIITHNGEHSGVRVLCIGQCITCLHAIASSPPQLPQDRALHARACVRLLSRA